MNESRRALRRVRPALLRRRHDCLNLRTAAIGLLAALLASVSCQSDIGGETTVIGAEWTSCSQHPFGTMLLGTDPGAAVTPASVMLHADEQWKMKGMVGAGAPARANADDSPPGVYEWFASLPGWTRYFMRGNYDSLVNVHSTASLFGMADMYECIAYGPESPHQAGGEALEPRTWVPKAESVAEAAGKCLVYGPSVQDYERMSTPEGQSSPSDALMADLIGDVAPHVDIWMVQLGTYQPMVDRGKDAAGNPYTMEDFRQWIARWVSWIKSANPNARVWTQLGVGVRDPIANKCLPPQSPEYILEFREALISAGVDGVWVMPAQPCQPCPANPAPGFPCSTDPQDNAYYQESLLNLQQAIDLTCGASDQEPPTSESACDDGVDNDDDGFVDCSDGDCESDPACTHEAGPGGEWIDCTNDPMGANLISWATSDFDDSTGPELTSLAEDGLIELVAATRYQDARDFFPSMSIPQKSLICNSHDCLRSFAGRDEVAYDILSYGPERLGGVPEAEKTNLPWATQVARDIADQAGKRLMISYSTKQLHQEALERGFGWDNVQEVVSMLAPHGDVWMIQAADEFNNPNNLDYGAYGPILSQRHYPPGPEWRAAVQGWVAAIRAANPDIEIWIQLGMHRIGSETDNYPSAELVLEYRDWLINPAHGPRLVDGIYITSTYSWAIDPVVADQEMARAFRLACGQEASGAGGGGGSVPSTVSLVEEGWTDDLAVGGITVLPGFYYRLFENSAYPCGNQGNHQFMVLDRSPDQNVPKHLFAKFLGGAVGMYYEDGSGGVSYYPHANAVGLLNQSLNRNWMFRTSVSAEFANGVTRRFRDNSDFRMVVPSYCSHDLYHGRGEFNAVDGFARYGYLAAMDAIDFVQGTYATQKVITYGGSAGGANFYIGNDQDNVAAIIMDSQAVDLSAIRDACYDGLNVFGNNSNYPCFCPDGGLTCMELLADRIGFSFGQDEPYRMVQNGLVDTPIYLVWNQRDASINAHLQYDNLHQTLEAVNPGGASVAESVCIDNPNSPPGPTCNLHVPTAYDYPDTEALVDRVYDWALSQLP